MSKEVRTEVLELHRFFEEWFTGRASAGEESIRRLESALADGFEIITPSGGRMSRNDLLARLRTAHGSRSGSDPPFRIRIEDLRVRRLGGGLYLATYREWQDVPDGPRGRLSSAILRDSSAAPNGVEWVHVHESWLTADG